MTIPFIHVSTNVPKIEFTCFRGKWCSLQRNKRNSGSKEPKSDEDSPTVVMNHVRELGICP